MLFNLRKKAKNDARKNTVIVEEMIGELNGLMENICKSTNSSMWDLVSGLDETTGAILGAAIKSSNKMLELAYEQAVVLDRYEEKLDQLTELTEKMYDRIDNSKVNKVFA